MPKPSLALHLFNVSIFELHLWAASMFTTFQGICNSAQFRPWDEWNGGIFYQQLCGGRHRIHKGRAEVHQMPIPDTKQTQMHVRLRLPNGASIDEDDIILIETIQHCRSILGTSKLLGLSYRTAWLMSDALNRMFECKVIETFPGRHAATEVTFFGQRLVALFRSIERQSAPRPLKRSTSLQLLLTGRTASRTPRGRLRLNTPNDPSAHGPSFQPL
jgi:molybdate transport system regulatory protein